MKKILSCIFLVCLLFLAIFALLSLNSQQKSTWQQPIAQGSALLLPQQIDTTQLPKQPIEPRGQPLPAAKIAVAASPSPPPPAKPKATAIAKAASPAPKLKSAACSGSYADQFLCLLNNYRISQGKGILTYNAPLSAVALGHSSWMDSTGIFSHTGINGSRLTERCNNAGIICHAENLAKGATSPQNLFDLWKASPSHNDVMLGNYTIIGLGISGQYATTLFN